jgi:hypothetical protein
VFLFLSCKPIVNVVEVIPEFFDYVFAFSVKLFVKVIIFQLVGF